MPSALRQPSRRFPLRHIGTDRVREIGAVGLYCQVPLKLENTLGQPPAPYRFVIDSGASYSMVGLELAQRDGIIIGTLEPEVVFPATTAQGMVPMRVRSGRIRAWWNDELRGYPYDWPVLFRVGAPLGTPPILGLGGVVKTCRWTFDGGYSPEAPYGHLTLDDIR